MTKTTIEQVDFDRVVAIARRDYDADDAAGIIENLTAMYQLPDGSTPTVSAPQAPKAGTTTSDGTDDSAVRDLARQYAASMPYEQALQRAREVIAAESGDIEHMSVAQLQDHIKGMDPAVIYEQDRGNDPLALTQEQADALLTAQDERLAGGAVAKALQRQQDAERDVALNALVKEGFSITDAKAKLDAQPAKVPTA